MESPESPFSSQSGTRYEWFQWPSSKITPSSLRISFYEIQNIVASCTTNNSTHPIRTWVKNLICWLACARMSPKNADIAVSPQVTDHWCVSSGQSNEMDKLFSIKFRLPISAIFHLWNHHNLLLVRLDCHDFKIDVSSNSQINGLAGTFLSKKQSKLQIADAIDAWANLEMAVKSLQSPVSAHCAGVHAGLSAK